MRAQTAVWTIACVLAVASPAWADFRLERRLPLAAGGTVTIDADRGAVTVNGDSTTEVRVLITARRDDITDRIDFDVTGGDRTARITGRVRHGLLSGWTREWWRGMDGLRFEIHVPQRAEVSVRTAGGPVRVSNLEGSSILTTSGGSMTVNRVVGDVRARTSGGPIAVEDVRGAVDAKTSGGSITVARIAGQVQLVTSGGPVRVDDVTGDLIATTSGGSITVRNAAGRVEARTSGGPIRATFSPGNQHGGRLTTSGGGVEAVLDPAVPLSINASTSGGNVVSDLPSASRVSTSRRHLQADINGGGALLEMRTSGGPIRVTAARSMGTRQ